jgi:hypothetical protein
MPRNYRRKGRPAEGRAYQPRGRKPINDAPNASAAQFAIHLEGADPRRAVRLAALALATQRQADKSPIPITRKNAAQRIREVARQLSAPLTAREVTLIQEALPDLEVARQVVQQSTDPRKALRDVLMLAIARALVRRAPILQEALAADPAFLGEICAWAREFADGQLARSIVTLPSESAGN